MKLIDYHVNKAGWATLEVWGVGGEEASTYCVSYLHDSLADLASMGLSLQAGQERATAVFMDEPGEVQIVVTGSGNLVRFELRGFSDWASWNMAGASSYEVHLQGEVSRAELVENIHWVLARIYAEVGPVRYRELWIEHDFPTAGYEQLSKALGLE